MCPKKIKSLFFSNEKKKKKKKNRHDSDIVAHSETRIMAQRPRISGVLHQIWYLVSPILIVLLNTNCKLRYSVTNTNC